MQPAKNAKANGPAANSVTAPCLHLSLVTAGPRILSSRCVIPIAAPRLRASIRLCHQPSGRNRAKSPDGAAERPIAPHTLSRRPDEDELAAVLGQELSHIAHRDLAAITVASSLGVLAGQLGA